MFELVPERAVERELTPLCALLRLPEKPATAVDTLELTVEMLALAVEILALAVEMLASLASVVLMLVDQLATIVETE